ncbi:helix-turn-helix domain-containing protein [Streptomyces sp. NPDC002285]
MHTEVNETVDLRQPPPLRAVRVSRGWTLRQVAARSGINPGHLSKVERGEKQLSIESLYRLAVVLELRELSHLLKPYISERESA